jgi:hypothetical protein
MADIAVKTSHIDHATSTTICSAIGERLRQTLLPTSSELPPQLERLLAEMERQERQTIKPR